MNLFYRHIFMQRVHIRTIIVVRSTKQKSQVLHHSRMQFWDITNILQEKIIDTLIRKSVLVELSNYLL